jgi:protein-disulfide isomerase
MNKGTAIVGFIACFLSGMGLMYGIGQRPAGGGDISADTSAAMPAGAWSDDGSPIPVSSKDPIWGNRDAPVTIVVFSDFQCPFCSRVEGTIDQLKQQYGKDKLRIVWKNEPLGFHDKAKPAAIAAQAVFMAKGSDAFWKFHAAAFKGQRELNDANYEKWAGEAGVDAATFKKFKDDPRAAAKVDEDHALAQKVGVNGTPHFKINGIELSGAQPIDEFKKVIDAQLEKAKAKQAAGVKGDRLYVELSKENFKAAPAQPDKKADAPKKEEDKTIWKVPVGTSPADGPDTAPVTVVIFSDFQCPFCKRVEDTLKEVKKSYGDKVRIVWKDQPLPFHPRAKPAAVLAREAMAQKGPKAFWEAHDKLFASAPKLEDADLENLAKEMGVDVAKFKDALAKDKYKEVIEADQNLADDLNASGTPHFFVNGRRLVGAQPIDKFKELIDEQMKVAEGLKAKGIAANKVYDEIMKEGKEPPPPEMKKIAAPGPDLPFKGGKDAKVVIQEFSDFQCPFCSRVEPTIKQVLDTYGTKVKVVWRHKPLPFHKDAPLASEATIEAFKQKGNDTFWKFHDILFEKQKEPEALQRPALEKYAEQLGLDMPKFKKALDTNAHKAAVDADSKIADDAGVSGTPAFIVTANGKPEGYFISGAQPFPKFKKVIDRALKEAKLAPGEGGRPPGLRPPPRPRARIPLRIELPRARGRAACLDGLTQRREQRVHRCRVLLGMLGRDAGLDQHHRLALPQRHQERDDLVDTAIARSDPGPLPHQGADLHRGRGQQPLVDGGAGPRHPLGILQPHRAAGPLQRCDPDPPGPVRAMKLVDASSPPARPPRGCLQLKVVGLDAFHLPAGWRPTTPHEQEHHQRKQPGQGREQGSHHALN